MRISKKHTAKIYIGTSGYAYNHWDKIFYPHGLVHSDKLKFYSKYFNSVEINNSFYRIPQKSDYIRWFSQSPDDFVFSIKVNRVITHIKRLKNVKLLLKSFIASALQLKQKLGPFLFQMPPSFAFTEEILKRLEITLSYLRGSFKNLDFVFEFRHKSFDNSAIESLFQKYNCAVAVSDSSRYPKINIPAGDISYFRMHGPKELFASCYSEKDIEKLAKTIKKLSKIKKKIYCYFNNDFKGYAVKNALLLKQELKL